ncbi:MAG: flagellar motor protein MotB [Candidatus Omnitrophota bacterium]|nr:flagellar motor protein MotB [Candidatus Omnitrophota bacterium]
MKVKFFKMVFVLFLLLTFSGCTFIFQKGRRSDIQKIEELSTQIDELEQAKRILEKRLGKEIQDKLVKLDMLEKGLVITVVGDLLFDSGKAQIRPEAYFVLDKVSRVLKENLLEFNVGIEGHTDNQPIKHSGWKSNWDLSASRALNVLHYMVKEKGVLPERRLSAVGYGEFHPVASNDTKEGKQLNRRVEIVVLPKVSKVKETAGALKEPLKNFK